MDRETIIRRLAACLPDTALLDLFPETPPGEIRRTLDPTLDRGRNKEESKVSPLAAGACYLYTDGASRGNPGRAGAGIVILDEQGRELKAESRYLGHCTNNSAEYQALILGLETARAMGCERLNIRMDSELIVNQLTGRYRVKNAGLKPLYERARQLLSCFDQVDINHVARAENRRADELANQGIDDHLNT